MNLTIRAGDKGQLTEYRDMLVTTRDKVTDLKKQGKTLEEVISANAGFDAKWGPVTEFLAYVYQGV